LKSSPRDPLKVLIVDDEPAGRRLLRTLLGEEPGIEIVGVCRHGEEAITVLRACPVDVVFLDICMPGKDGFDVVRALDPRPAIVFVTAYDHFALKAFEVEAWDYLLKPFDEVRLGETLSRVRKRFAREKGTAESELEPEVGTAQEPPLERLALPLGRGRVTVSTDRIIAIEAESNYARFHLSRDVPPAENGPETQGSHLARISLTSLEERLDRRRFVRVHRSWIINVDHLGLQEPAGHGDLLLTMSNGLQVNLSRRYRDRLEAVLQPLS